MKYFREMLRASVAHKPLLIGLAGGFPPDRFHWRLLRVAAALAPGELARFIAEQKDRTP